MRRDTSAALVVWYLRVVPEVGQKALSVSWARGGSGRGVLVVVGSVEVEEAVVGFGLRIVYLVVMRVWVC